MFSSRSHTAEFWKAWCKFNVILDEKLLNLLEEVLVEGRILLSQNLRILIALKLGTSKWNSMVQADNKSCSYPLFLRIYIEFMVVALLDLTLSHEHNPKTLFTHNFQ
jgi:hypothetical protein